MAAKKLRVMNKTKGLAKGESVKFLDYTIANSRNNDGLVLYKKSASALSYEQHLGNYGEGTPENVELAKKCAVMYFMLARPNTFATTMFYRAMGRGGQYHEYYLLKDAIEKEGMECPEEITCGNDGNAQGYYRNKKIKF